MKKTVQELRQLEGWQVVTGCRAYCSGCGHLIDFKDSLYHRKEAGREVIRCISCATVK